MGNTQKVATVDCFPSAEENVMLFYWEDVKDPNVQSKNDFVSEVLAEADARQNGYIMDWEAEPTK